MSEEQTRVHRPHAEGENPSPDPKHVLVGYFTRHRSSTAALLLLAGLAWSQSAVPPEERRDWFDDPFFRISSGRPDCPVPLGPLLTVDEKRREAHGRIERGTSCWLAGKCRDSNAYRYDKALASPVATALTAVPGIERSSVWVTIQRRWVFLEGCVETPEQIARLEQAVRTVPDVESVVPVLSVGSEAPRYRLLNRTLPTR